MNTPIFTHERGASALLISFPHSGISIPEDLRARLTPAALQVPDTDWHVPQLYDFHRDIGASVLIAQYSRYVVDLNRPSDGAPLYPGQAETGICPTRTFADEPLYQAGQELKPDEVSDRIREFWAPYHQKLTQEIDAIRTQHGHCILWDAHSIRSQVPLFFDGLLPDLNVGTADERSCSRVISQRVMRELQSQTRFSCVLNGRFKGGYITRRYGDPARGVNAVQLEIAQRAYLSEATAQRYDAQTAAELKRTLHALLAAVIKV